MRDLTGLLWSSIDNDDSRDLDQIEWAERTTGGIRVLVGVADVDSLVAKGTPIDAHAARETTTVYTGVRIVSHAAGAALDRPDLARRRPGPRARW